MKIPCFQLFSLVSHPKPRAEVGDRLGARVDGAVGASVTPGTRSVAKADASGQARSGKAPGARGAAGRSGAPRKCQSPKEKRPLSYGEVWADCRGGYV
eukprot:COSAG05_NODE_4948_length_1317_cov_0.930213_1_plen_97_part_10